MRMRSIVTLALGSWYGAARGSSLKDARRAFLHLALVGVIGLGLTAPLRGQVSQSCPHVRLLGPADRAEVHWSHEDEIVSPEEHHRSVVAEALDLLPPSLCTALQRVVFVDESDSSARGWTKKNDRQDLLYLNVATGAYGPTALSHPVGRAEAIHTILHETAHIGVRLLTARTDAAPPGWTEWRPAEDLWRAEALAAADEVIAKLRLEKGFFQEWSWIHSSFKPLGWAGDYYDDDWRQQQQADHVRNGFTSAYGGENEIEDIAEMTGWALSAPLFPETAAEDIACQAMRGSSGPGIKPEFAAVFAKVGFLHAAGFLDDQAYSRCVGNVRIRGSGAGFFSFKDGQLDRTYSGEVERKIGQAEEAGPWLFSLSALGTVDVSGEGAVPVVIEIVLSVAPGDAEKDAASYPRGLHPVGFRLSKHDRLNVYRKDDGRRIVEVTDGLVLISRASRDLVEGSVAVRRYFNFSTSLSAIAGDEPPSKPTTITFRFEE